jgi:hypothetical protein
MGETMEKGTRVVVTVGGERQRGIFAGYLWGGRAMVVFEVLMSSPRYACTILPASMVREEVMS